MEAFECYLSPRGLSGRHKQNETHKQSLSARPSFKLTKWLGTKWDPPVVPLNCAVKTPVTLYTNYFSLDNGDPSDEPPSPSNTIPMSINLNEFEIMPIISTDFN